VTVFRIEKLSRSRGLDAFDCGNAALNRFLSRFAWGSQQASAAQTYVGLADQSVIGYYTLVVAEVAFADAPNHLIKGLARHPMPLMLLARLAVDRNWPGRGLAAGLMKDAMRRTVQAADIAGIRALTVHAKDDAARAFYRRFDFIESPTDPLHLFLLLKDLRRYVPGA
jgi:GNAT superfamily N-acetyltransferase